jgi:hypothetical protein
MAHTVVRRWLMSYAASRNVAGSSSDKVIDLFYLDLPNPSSFNMSIGLLRF